VGGTGVVRVWCCPAGRRTCAVMVSRVLVTVLPDVRDERAGVIAGECAGV
jgi:hypothetical protein